MKVIVKKPGLGGEVIEVADLKEINKIVGNLDKDGNGLNHASSDIRMNIGHNVDLYVKEDAINNFDLEQNMWAPGDCAVFFGNAIFAGYDQNKNEDSGACSLTEEQIKYVLDFIARQTI